RAGRDCRLLGFGPFLGRTVAVPSLTATPSTRSGIAREAKGRLPFHRGAARVGPVRACRAARALNQGEDSRPQGTVVMSERVPTSLRGTVQAHFRCEYCLIHEEDAHFSHQPDHVIARKHRGPTL